MIERTDRGFALNLRRLRLVSIAAPVAFVAIVEALSIFALGFVIPNPLLRFLLVFALITVSAVPFTVWVFRVIERQARDSEQSAMLLDSVGDHAIFMLDAEGRILTWNKGAERIKGYAADDVTGRSFALLYSPEDVAAGVPQTNLARAREVGSTEYEGWRVRKDGSRFWSNVVVTAVHGDPGTIIGFSVVTRDTTERMRAQKQIKRLNEELEARVAQLADANNQIERRNRQLTAVNAAIVAVSSPSGGTPLAAEVLQRIVDSARELVDATYGALGVAGDDGTMVQFITSGITDEQRIAIGPLPKGSGLLGLLIQERTSLRLANMQDHPVALGFHPTTRL